MRILLLLLLFMSSVNAQILAYGDSLTAGYQLPENQGFTKQLEAALKKDGINIEVINGGVSGDTTQGGLDRLTWSLTPNVKAVILELGANDALRGLSPVNTKDNLDKIIIELKAKNIKILLAGMIAPPNLGEDYAKSFNPLYKELADKHQIPLYPFFLEGIAANKALNLADGMHPNNEGVAIIVKNILPLVKKLIE